jgi:hypothetical protein
MKPSKKSSSVLILLPLLLVLLILLVIGFIAGGVGRTQVEDINQHLDIDGVKLGMREAEVVRLWGEGEYVNGFGGHGREYKDRQISLGFAGDSDNDLYGAVSTIELRNPSSSIYGVKIGDPMEEADAQVKLHGFKLSDNGLYVKDEFTIAIRGSHTVELLQVWFNDRDLKDRVY